MNRSVLLGAALAAGVVTLGLLPVAGGAVGVEGVGAERSAAAPDLPELVRRYATDRRALERFHDLPWSEARLERLGRFLEAWRERVEGIPAEGLGVSERVDLVLLRHAVAAESARLALEERRLAEIEPLLPFREAVLRLETARRGMEPLDPAAAAGEVAAIAEAATAIRGRVQRAADGEAKGGGGREGDENGALRVTPVVALRAAGAAERLQRTLASWHGFYDGFDPTFSWWVRRPYADASKALKAYAEHLREKVAGVKGEAEDPLVGDPIGSEALAADLAAEMIAYTPEELVAIAEAELAWCEGRMRAAAREMGLGDDWKAALERVKGAHVPPGEQDDLVREQAREAIAFVTERGLVTIPPLCEETWRLTMLSAEQQRTLPFAVYFGQAMGVAYPTDGMSHEEKVMSMRGNNVHFSRIVTPHELIPGHHLQGFYAQRERTHRSEFRTPFLVEGWAVYWEMRLWDLGYPRSPEDRVGMLLWRMHRCARVIVSLRFHLGLMSPEAMVDFLVERVGLERSGAAAEVRRYIGGDYGPLYQCGYMIGAIQLRALHEELVRSGRMTDRAFNDAVLACNAIPIEMIRAELTGRELAPDHTASWKFAGEKPGAE